MKKLRIYVAGPLTSHDKDVVKRNREIAIKFGEEILKKGHLPYVPHSHFRDWNIDIHKDYDLFFEHGVEILKKWADALFLIAPSKGADAEKEEAEKLGLKIFTSLDEIPEYKPDD